MRRAGDLTTGRLGGFERLIGPDAIYIDTQVELHGAGVGRF
jgi:hypothetical protein